ncbi:hypothetical protein OAO87_04720 [bacterium]|nr:hypothetical protein [bacterium]
MPVTMKILDEAIRKLRMNYARTPGVSVASEGEEGGAVLESGAVLYRGLHDMKLAGSFLEGRQGGAEMAFMSTTFSFEVAVGFTLQSRDGLPVPARDALMLRLVTDNIVNSGADVSYLSVNPGEGEVIFPPLCFLKPTGHFQVEVLNEDTILTVVEVRPLT